MFLNRLPIRRFSQSWQSESVKESEALLVTNTGDPSMASLTPMQVSQNNRDSRTVSLG
jgi:hypothetical protein